MPLYGLNVLIVMHNFATNICGENSYKMWQDIQLFKQASLKLISLNMSSFRRCAIQLAQSYF